MIKERKYTNHRSRKMSGKKEHKNVNRRLKDKIHENIRKTVQDLNYI